VTARPTYRELPFVAADSDYRHAWDYYRPGDNVGALANLTDQARLAGLAAATSGESIGLSLPLSQPDPPLFRREPLTHTVFASGRNGLDDRLDSFYPQGSTQWDGFRHVRAREHGFFTGIQGDFGPDDDRLGIGHWAGTGVIGRGVLFDFGHLCDDAIGAGGPAPATTITAHDLRTMGDAMGIRPGDIVCLRTGWMKLYRASDARRRAELASSTTWPGLSAAAEMAEVLWDWGVAAVAADNPAVEVSPGSPVIGSLHRRLIPLLGIPLGELFDLEQLSARCAAQTRSSFLFVSVPLNLPGGVGSPGNAVAVL
jgi:kynurenine formamidase